PQSLLRGSSKDQMAAISGSVVQPSLANARSRPDSNRAVIRHATASRRPTRVVPLSAVYQATFRQSRVFDGRVGGASGLDPPTRRAFYALIPKRDPVPQMFLSRHLLAAKFFLEFG